MTNLYLTSAAADTGVTGGTGTKWKADWSPGASARHLNKNTVTGPTVSLQVTDSATAGTDGTAVSWYSPPLRAVTIAGQVVATLWDRENANANNVRPEVGIERCDGAGNVISTICDPNTNNAAGEMATTAGGASDTVTVSAGNVVDTTLADGDRLRITLWINDAVEAVTNMASGGQGEFWINGPAGSQGQAQFAFTETLIEYFPAAPSIAAFETADWNTSASSTKSITVTGCLAGDLIAVLYGGENVAAVVSAASVSTTSGSTGSWTEPEEGLAAANQGWVSSSVTTVTADGDVTIALSRTQSTPGIWGGMALRCRNHGGVGVHGRSAPSATETLSLTVAESSVVAVVAIDWDALATVAFSPAGALDVERAQEGTPDITVYAGYWPGQHAGTRGYGIATSSTTNLHILGIEILANTGLTVSPTGIASAEAFGTTTVATTLTASPTGISSAEALGSPAISFQTTATPTGIGSAEAFGTATASLGVLTTAPTGIGSEEAFGSPTASTGGTTPTIRASTTYASTASEASSTVPLPTGWQVGDVVYIGWELTASSGTVTTPSGWAAVVAGFRSAGQTNCATGVLRRVMQAGDTAPAIAHTSGRFAAISTAVQNADTTTPEDVTPTTSDNTGITYPSVDAPSITPATAGCLLLTFHAIRNGTNGASASFSPPSGMTEEADISSAVAAVSNAAIELASQALTGTAATGIKTATVTSSSGTTVNPMGVAIAVRPATTGGGTTVSPSGIGTAEAFGTPTASATLTTQPTGIATGELFGSVAVALSLLLSPGGIASSETFGTTAVAPGAITVAPTGIASSETFGSATASLGVLTASPAGIASAQAFGAANVSLGSLSVLAVGISSAETFGVPTASTGSLTASPTGIVSAEAFGTAAVTVSGTAAPVGIPSAEVFGVPVAMASLSVAATGIASSGGFGTPVATLLLTAVSTGIPSAAAFGTPTAVLTLSVAPTGVPSTGAFGLPAAQTFLLAGALGIASSEAFGIPSSAGGVVIPPRDLSLTGTLLAGRWAADVIGNHWISVVEGNNKLCTVKSNRFQGGIRPAEETGEIVW